MRVTHKTLAIVCFGCLTLGSPGAWAQTPDSSPTPAVVESTGPVTEESRAQAREELRKGVELARQGYTESAIVSLRKAIELDPQLVEAYAELGRILVESRNTAFAITIYSKLVDLEPQNAQWKEILMELQMAYDQPRGAMVTGEDLLQLRPNDTAVMAKLVELYKANDLPYDEAAMWNRLANARGNDANAYYQAGKLYLSLNMNEEAMDALEAAVRLDKTNLEYSAALAQAYQNAGLYDTAEALLQEQIKFNPEAVALKDRLAEVYVGRGDEYLERERYMGARDWYRRAKELLPANSSLGKSIDERIATAEDRYGPFVDNWTQYSQFQIGGVTNDDWQVITRYSQPVGEEDLYVQAWHDFRSVSAPGVGDAWIHLARVGMEWRPDPYATVQGWGGTEGLFRLGGSYETDRGEVGFFLVRDINHDTPLALANKLKYFGQTGYADIAVTDWMSIAGDFLHARYEDGSDQIIANIGPFFTLMQEEGVYEWGVGYTHGVNRNDPPQNPFIRFGPANLHVDTVGTRFTHTPSKRWRYYLGLYRSWFNDGSPPGNTYEVGVDAKLNDTSFIRLDYQYGATPLGGIPLTGSSNPNNQTIRSQIHFTF